MLPKKTIIQCKGDMRKDTVRLSFKIRIYSNDNEKFNVTDIGHMSKKAEVTF